MLTRYGTLDLTQASDLRMSGRRTVPLVRAWELTTAAEFVVEMIILLTTDPMCLLIGLQMFLLTVRWWACIRVCLFSMLC